MTLAGVDGSAAPNRRLRPWRIDDVLVYVWIVAFAALRAGTIQDNDVYWQVRAGNEQLAGSPLIRPDSWSWAPVGGDWVPNSPAWNLVLAGSWNAAGYWGLFALGTFTLTALLLLSYRVALRLGAIPLVALPVLTVLWFAAFPFLSLRATVPAQLLVLLGICFAVAWSTQPTRSRTIDLLTIGVAAFALSALGNWVHLSWAAFALLLTGVWAAVWVLSAARRWGHAAARTAVSGVGFLLGIFAGPYGWDVWAHTARVAAACTGLIQEWAGPLTEWELIPRWGIPVVLVIVVAGFGAVRAWNSRRLVVADERWRLIVALVLVSAPFALASLTAVRFVGIAALGLAPVAAVLMSEVAKRFAARRPSRLPERWFTARYWRRIVVGVLVLVVPASAVLAAPHATQRSQAAVEALPAGCALFARTDESDLAILIRPDVEVWFDGRADYYGRNRVFDAQWRFSRATAEEAIPAGATCVLLDRESAIWQTSALIASMNASVRWRVSFDDGRFLVWTRAAESA
ncbi:MAG: hypothetical protein ACKOXM_00620 [Agromyces sp.]